MTEVERIAAQYNTARTPRTAQWLLAQIERNEQTLRLGDTYYWREDGSIGGGNSHRRAQEALVALRAELAKLERINE